MNEIICGDAREVLKKLPSESIDFVMFSPPYYGLRNYGEGAETIWGGDPNCEHEWSTIVKPKERGSYGKSSWRRPSRDHETKWNNQYSNFCVKCGAWKGQLGLEPSWRMYIDHLVEICRELKRVLKKTGSMYIVIGDTYFGGGHGGDTLYRLPSGELVKSVKQGRSSNYVPKMRWKDDIYKPKCLMGIPWRLAFALIDDGWILRNDIIWYKPNHMPESVKDRLTRSYEHIFHFVKSRRYYYNLDMIREPHTSIKDLGRKRLDTQTPKHDLAVKLRAGKMGPSGYLGQHSLGKNPGDTLITKHDEAVGRIGNYSYTDPLHTKPYNLKGKNPGDYWMINTRPFKGVHFAVYPVDICLRPILSSCPPNGIVLDPMAGSGTTLLAAELINHGRWDEFRIPVNEYARRTKWNLKWIGIDINPEYCEIARKRLEPFKVKRLDEFIASDVAL